MTQVCSFCHESWIGSIPVHFTKINERSEFWFRFIFGLQKKWNFFSWFLKSEFRFLICLLLELFWNCLGKMNIAVWFLFLFSLIAYIFWRIWFEAETNPNWEWRNSRIVFASRKKCIIQEWRLVTRSYAVWNFCQCILKGCPHIAQLSEISKYRFE